MNAENLTRAQRMDMVSKGLNPLDPSHLQKYIQTRGQVRMGVNESAERLKNLIGIDAFNKDLGCSKESDSQYQQAANATGLTGGLYSHPEFQNYNEDEADSMGMTGVEFMRQQMGNMNNNPQFQKIKSRIKENSNTKTSQQNNQPNNLNQFYRKGYDLTIEYLNAFIMNVKNPSTQNRLQVFNLLKQVLQFESKLQNEGVNVNLSNFRQGCAMAENELYQKIKR